MNFIDEQQVARFEIGQQRRQIARPFEYRPGSLTQLDAHLLGQDVRKRGLAEARRSEDQHMIECVAAAARCFDGNPHLFAHRRLPHVVGESKRPDRSEEHTSELQSLLRISYAVFCLKKKKNNKTTEQANQQYLVRLYT